MACLRPIAIGLYELTKELRMLRGGNVMKIQISMYAFALAFVLFGSYNASASEFEQYPAEPSLTGKIHLPVLSTKEIRLFCTNLKRAAQEGPNFNGHYSIAYWGCGTNCIEWAIINLQTGSVFMRGGLESCWPSEAEEDPKEDIPEWFENKVSSSLLYVYECKEYSGYVTYDTRSIYRWTGNDLVFLRSEHVQY